MVKIRFQTDSRGLSDGSPESLWAKQIKTNELLFEIHNSPFYAKGISYLDVIEAVENGVCPGEFFYKRTVSPSGHSTYRILTSKASDDFNAWWARLSALGCTYEYADLGERLLYAVDVPPTTDIFRTYAVLEEGEARSVWEFDEGHCGHSTNRPDLE
jgi:hypothetical protein